MPIPTTQPIIGHYRWDQLTQSLHSLLPQKDGTDNLVKRLTNKQQALLTCLYTAYPAPVSNQNIVQTVWGSEHISVESLPQLISRTRQVLSDSSKTLIVNHPGHGYSLTLTDIPQHSAQNTAVDDITINRDPLNGRKLIEKLATSFIRPKTLFSLLLLATVWNGLNLWDVYEQRQSYEAFLFHTRYPYISKTEQPHQLFVTIGNETCLYDQKTKTLDCP